MAEMPETLYRVSCGQFTGGLVFDETGTVIKAAPFLSRLRGRHMLYTLSHILSWNGAVVELVSPGLEPNIPTQMTGNPHMPQEPLPEWKQWEKLERLDLDTIPYTMGRQARCIGAGCPFRPGTEAYKSFMDGYQFQDLIYKS